MEAILQAAVKLGLYPDDCFALLVIAGVSCVGLLSVWAALGRPHWFARVAVLLCVLSLGLLIPAYEAVVVFLIESLVVFLPLALFRRFRAARRAASAEGSCSAKKIIRGVTRFSLLDLVLATVAFAAVAGLVACAPRETWTDAHTLKVFSSPPLPEWKREVSAPWVAMLWAGGYWGLVTLIGACVVVGPWLLVPVGVALLLLLRLPTSFFVPTFAVIAVWLVMARAGGWIGRRDIGGCALFANARRRRPRRAVKYLARLGTLLLSAALVLPPLFTFWWLLNPAPIPEQAPLPSPNGYDALVEAGKGFENVAIPDWEAAPRSVLATFVANNSKLFALVRSGLDQPCRVPLRYSVEYMEYIGSSESLSLCYVPYALLAEAKAQELDGRTDDAIRTYLDLIRFGSATSRGGLGNDFLGEQITHENAMRGVYGLRDRIPPGECRRLIGVFQAVEANYEPVSDVLAREDAFWDHWAGWQGRLYTTFDEWASSLRYSERRLRDIRRHQQAYVRMVTCELALRLYELDTGTPAASLEDLVPKYLDAVPIDPFSGEPIVYVIDGDTHVVYSVGPDQTDDGGDHDDDLRLDEPPPESGN